MRQCDEGGGWRRSVVAEQQCVVRGGDRQRGVWNCGLQQLDRLDVPQRLARCPREAGRGGASVGAGALAVDQEQRGVHLGAVGVCLDAEWFYFLCDSVQRNIENDLNTPQYHDQALGRAEAANSTAVGDQDQP